LQIFELVRFTDDGVDVEIPQMFIPFYYLWKKAKVVEPEEKEKEEVVSVDLQGPVVKEKPQKLKDEEKEPVKRKPRKTNTNN
jgi:hypothetical protein